MNLKEAVMHPQAASKTIVRKIRNYGQLQAAMKGMLNTFPERSSLEQRVEYMRGHGTFKAVQQQTEILRLLRMLEKQPPKYVCEIGTWYGGTLFLLAKNSRPDALIISIDRMMDMERAFVHGKFASGKQRLVTLREDSGASETVQKVRGMLGGQKLDLLFIDGDHSYEAVKKDFEKYNPLVRSGGLIVFHDIVPDWTTRFGKRMSLNYAGGVPIFWKELKAKYKTGELIEDPEQDGFGLGVLYA